MRERNGRNCLSLKLVTSCPLKMICPEVAWSSLRTQRPIVVLPDPVSPTSASVSLGYTSKETSFTACTTSLELRSGKCFTRCSTRITGWTVSLTPPHFHHAMQTRLVASTHCTDTKDA